MQNWHHENKFVTQSQTKTVVPQVSLVTYSLFYSVYSIYGQLLSGGAIASNSDFHLVPMEMKTYHNHDNQKTMETWM
jgi:hypothetical protein